MSVDEGRWPALVRLARLFSRMTYGGLTGLVVGTLGAILMPRPIGVIGACIAGAGFVSLFTGLRERRRVKAVIARFAAAADQPKEDA